MAMFEITLAQAAECAIRCLEVGKVPCFKSSPGLGKSAMAKETAKRGNLKLIDLRMSQMQDVDFMGIPFREGEKARFLPFSTLFPLEDTPIPEGYSGWLIFLDEITSISRSVEAAAYKLVYDRMVGEYHLHPNVFIMAAGNRETDKAVARKLGTALQSRMIHYTIRSDHKGTMDYMVRSGFDYRVTGFLEFRQELMNNFDPESSEETFACPRTWEFLSDIIKPIATEDIFLPDIAGAVGAGAAVEFNEYVQEYAKLPRYSEIIANPKTAQLPPQQSTRYAVVSMILSRATIKDFEDLVPYVKRLNTEFQIIFFRGFGTRFTEFKRESAFRNATKDLTEFLYASDDTTRQAA